MKRILIAAALLAVPLATSSTQGFAQTASCPGGEAKTASGVCVNPGLSASLRQRSILLSQARISETAFPVPPTEDRTYPRPGEYNRYELIRGVFSTNPSPFSCHPNCVVTPRAPVVTTLRPTTITAR